MDLMFQPLRKYADFEGRARRSEVWLFWLFYLIVVVVGEAIAAVGGMQHIPALQLGAAGLVVIFALACIIPMLAVQVRRLHDTNRSGWWLLIHFLPFLGALVLLIFFLLEGTAGPNRFGPDPKGRGEGAQADTAFA